MPANKAMIESETVLQAECLAKLFGRHMVLRDVTFELRQGEIIGIVSQLSGGTKQKLNLSLALLHSPDILILDEPYSGFDWETYLRFWDYAEELQSRGKSILIVSHFANDRSKFASLYELREGILECA